MNLPSAQARTISSVTGGAGPNEKNRKVTDAGFCRLTPSTRAVGSTMIASRTWRIGGLRDARKVDFGLPARGSRGLHHGMPARAGSGRRAPASVRPDLRYAWPRGRPGAAIPLE